MNRIEKYINEHGSIILASMEPWPIGDVSDQATSYENGYFAEVRQPLVVVRQCTREEFEAQSEDIPKGVPAKYFYEVRTD